MVVLSKISMFGNVYHNEFEPPTPFFCPNLTQTYLSFIPEQRFIRIDIYTTQVQYMYK